MFVNVVPPICITCLPVAIPLPSTSSVMDCIVPTSKEYASDLNPVDRREYVPKLDAELVTEAYPPD